MGSGGDPTGKDGRDRIAKDLRPQFEKLELYPEGNREPWKVEAGPVLGLCAESGGQAGGGTGRDDEG